MRVIKSFLIALSMYSKVPVPRTEWKEEDMKYVFCFFPFVGVIIGTFILGWNFICFKFSFPELLRIFVTAAIPLIITGGIHVDGFMDTMDAFHSYREREKKLEILKDPHIGAFSVIMLGLYGLIFVGFLSVINDLKTIALFAISFVLARCISGFCALSFKSAKEGTLNLFAKNSSKNFVRVVTVIEAIICIAGMAFLNWIPALGVAGVCVFTTLYYFLKTKKEFGGVTGDTAGYLVLILERNSLIIIAVVTLVFEVITNILKLY